MEQTAYRRETIRCWPVIEPRMDKTADGQRIGIEAFLDRGVESPDCPASAQTPLLTPKALACARLAPRTGFCAAAPTLPTRGRRRYPTQATRTSRLQASTHPRAARKTLSPDEWRKVAFPEHPRRSLSSTCTGAGCGTSGMDELALQDARTSTTTTLVAPGTAYRQSASMVSPIWLEPARRNQHAQPLSGKRVAHAGNQLQVATAEFLQHRDPPAQHPSGEPVIINTADALGMDLHTGQAVWLEPRVQAQMQWCWYHPA